MSDRIVWIKPIIVDGVVRWPLCEDQVTDPQARRNRDEDDQDCALAAKVDYRGTNLCKRHAAKRLLSEFVQPVSESGESR